MGRIIINYDDTVNDVNAMHLVSVVMAIGRISKLGGGDCYSLATKFRDGSVVCASLTRTGNDVFTVYLEK